MPIRVVCSGCGKRYKARDDGAGKSVPCQVCKTLIPIPLSSGSKDDDLRFAEEEQEENDRLAGEPIPTTSRRARVQCTTSAAELAAKSMDSPGKVASPKGNPPSDRPPVILGDSRSTSVPSNLAATRMMSLIERIVNESLPTILYCVYFQHSLPLLKNLVQQSAANVEPRPIIRLFKARDAKTSEESLLLVAGGTPQLLDFELRLKIAMEKAFGNATPWVKSVRNFAPPGYELSPESRFPKLLAELTAGRYEELS